MADPRIVAKFTESRDLQSGAVPIASLSMLWYLEPDGEEGVLTKFDGEQRVSVSVGDVIALVHEWLHADEEAK
jgi:hypothetical protein